MEKRSHAGGRRESYFPCWLLVSTWDVVGPPRSHAERGAGFCPPQGQLTRMLWQCRHHGLGSSVKSVLGAPAGAVPAHRHPHPHPRQHPGPWPPAEGRGQGGRLAGLGAMAKHQSLLGPGEEGRVDAQLRGAPSAVLLLSWVDLEARKAAPEPACLNLSLAHCSLVLRPQQAASPPRAPFSPPVKPASKHSPVLGP